MLANIPMNEIRLTYHRVTPPVSAKHVDVEIRTAGAGRLFARFVIECDTSLLILPEPHESLRSDRLWQTTCFELFIQPEGKERYFEYNFSPSTEWALYRFSDYRKGMAEEMISRPRISCDYSESHFGLNAEFDLPDSIKDLTLNFGASAVVEESEGKKSYWALAHPSDEPDFHHRDCFALRLDAPRAA